MFALIVLMSSLSYCLTPPAAVKKAFEQKFPNVTKVKWGKETKTVFEAEFVFKGIKTSANFSQDGSWVETETQIKISELPNAVTNAINKDYPKSKILKAEKTESDKNGITYETLIKSGKHKKAVEFKEDGTPFKE